MWRNILLILLFLIGSKPLIWSQQKGRIEVNADYNINRIMDAYSQLMLENPTMKGFRIQIFFDSGNTSKQAAITTKNSFEKNFPDIEAYISFEEPNYKVRVGNFRTKLDAERCRKKIIASYPSAFVVPDRIVYPELENNAPIINDNTEITE